MCFPCVRLQLTRALVPQRQKKPFLYVGLDKHALITAVKLKASHHKPCSFANGREYFSRKEQLLPALVVLLSWPLCVLIPGQILSTAVPTLSEENRKNSAALQASAFCYYGYDSIMAGQRFTPAHWKRERNVFTPSTLMELKAKGVFVQRGDHQPLNVGSSSRKPHLTIHSYPTAIFFFFVVCKMASPPRLQPEKHHAGWRNQTGRDVTLPALLITPTVCFLWPEPEWGGSACYSFGFDSFSVSHAQIRHEAKQSLTTKVTCFPICCC